MSTASKVLQVARGELGYSRWSDPGEGTKYGRWMARVTRQAWFARSGVPYCNMFTSWVLATAGVREPAPGHFAYVPSTIKEYARQGRRLGNKHSAVPGDLVCFDWDGDGVADHIGICEANNGSYLTCIEGNTSGSWQGSQSNGGGVYRRTRGWSGICAVLRPDYTGSQPAQNASHVAEDGYWGASTTRALQQINGTPMDGVISSQEAANKQYMPAATSGWEWTSNPVGSQLIARMQRAFGVSADGIMGPGTVKAMQKYYGVGVDGYMGVETVRAMQRAINRQLGGK